MEKAEKAVLFDMDGVLVRSEPIIRKAAKAALSEWGVTARDEDFTDFIGAGEDRFVGGVAEKHGVPYDVKMKERAYEIYETLVKDEIVVYAGVKETLAALRARGFRLALCSSADMIKVKMNLSAAEIPFEAFDHVVSGDGVARKKPFPDVFLAASDALGVPPEHLEKISGYLDDWENVGFDDRRLVLDGLISVIKATSENIQIEWKV